MAYEQMIAQKALCGSLNNFHIQLLKKILSATFS